MQQLLMQNRSSYTLAEYGTERQDRLAACHAGKLMRGPSVLEVCKLLLWEPPLVGKTNRARRCNLPQHLLTRKMGQH